MSHQSPPTFAIDAEGVAAENSKHKYTGPEKLHDHLARVTSNGGIWAAPEVFEKIYLNSLNRAGGQLHKTFGNPTPLGLTGFVIALTPLCCVLMGWRGTTGNPNAEIGPFYWFGGALQIIAGLLEFFVGNTFPFVVLCSFGAFFLSFAVTLTPDFSASASYNSPAEFHAAFGYFTLFVGLLCLVYMICALRVNVVFFSIFLTLVVALSLLTASHWAVALDSAKAAERFEVGAGAVAFLSAVLGWYLLTSQLLQAVEFPFRLPVGDLRAVIKGRDMNQEKASDA